MGKLLLLGMGELGAAVAAELVPRAATRGMRCDVLLRAGSGKSAQLARSFGADVVEGDLAAMSQTEIAARFSGYDTVLSCIGFAAGSGTQLKLARAALEAGVRRYFPWQFGVDYDALGRGSPQPLFDEQLDVRDLLRSQHATHWVIISVGMFTSFLFEPSFGVVDLAGGGVRALGSWENAVTLTTPQDIGRLTAEIVLETPELNDQVMYLAGDTITYGHLADVVQNALQRPVRREVWSTEFLETQLREVPEDTFRKYRAVFALRRGMSWPQAGTYNAQRGFPVTNAATWLQLHLAGHR